MSQPSTAAATAAAATEAYVYSAADFTTPGTGGAYYYPYPTPAVVLSEDPYRGWGVDASSSVRIYGHSQGMMASRASGSKYTHTFMAGGGKLNLVETPQNKRDFRIAAAQPMQLNTVSEEAEEEFCAFLEVDTPAAWRKEFNDVFMRVACAVFAAFFPGVTFLLYLSTKASGAGGMHVVAPDLCVTRARMLKMRRYLITCLQRDGQLPSDLDYEELIDRKVYTEKHAHMRLNFSYKAVQHHACFRGNKYAPSVPCTNNPPCKHGFNYEPDSYYRVECVYRPDGTRDANEELLVTGPHLESRVKQLERTSIRHTTRQLTAPFVTPLDCPQDVDDSTKRFQKKFGIEALRAKTIGDAAQTFTLDRRDPIFDAIQEFIRHHSGRSEWRFIEIQDITYKLVGLNNAYRKYYIYPDPKKSGGTCCLNRMPNEFGIRQHKSAPIYFILCANGLKQRCNAGTKKTNRVKANGKVLSCSQFESNEIPIRPMSFVARIFPPNASPAASSLRAEMARKMSRSQSGASLAAASASSMASSRRESFESSSSSAASSSSVAYPNFGTLSPAHGVESPHPHPPTSPAASSSSSSSSSVATMHHSAQTEADQLRIAAEQEQAARLLNQQKLNQARLLKIMRFTALSDACKQQQQQQKKPGASKLKSNVSSGPPIHGALKTVRKEVSTSSSSSSSPALHQLQLSGAKRGRDAVPPQASPPLPNQRPRLETPPPPPPPPPTANQ